MADAAQDEQSRLYLVVVNHEEQYSVWPADRDLPAGWASVGEPAPRESCLDHIATIWTDMRPLSLRKAMEADQH